MQCAVKKPSPKVSRRMKLVKRSGSLIERQMEVILKNNDWKYEKQPEMVGHPDFKIKGTNILVFCDSSFWHGRKKTIESMAFKTNRSFWVGKIEANRLRDTKTNRLLRRNGWRVTRFWDADILKRPVRVAEKLREYING